MARWWLEVTQDSWVVDVRVVTGPGGAANYLGKYLGKSMADYRYRLLELGYLRRFQRSVNWPGGGQMEFEATVEEEWEEDRQWNTAKVLLPGDVVDGTATARSLDRFKRVGTEMAMKFQRRARRNKAKVRLEAWMS